MPFTPAVLEIIATARSKAVINEVEAHEPTAAIDAAMGRLAGALKAATAAKTLHDTMRRASAAQQAADALLRQLEDDRDEEEAELLLLM